MTVANSIKAQLDEAEHVIRAQMARIAELEAENARLVAECNAHQTLRAIYSDSTQPTGVRVKAAIGCLPHETPRLTPVQPPLELIAEPVVPLAELVEQRRARQDALCPASKRSDKVLELLPVTSTSRSNGGNGTDDNNA